MPLVATERSPVSRKRALGVFLRQGVVGLLLLAWLTATRLDEPARILRALGSPAPILVAILIAFAFTLALLKFPLSDQIFVSLMVTAVLAIFPLLGPVMTAWIAVLAAVAARRTAMRRRSPSRSREGARRDTSSTLSIDPQRDDEEASGGPARPAALVEARAVARRAIQATGVR